MDVFTDILSAGKNSRLYKSLVYEKQVAQAVSAYQDGSEISGQLAIVITAKPGKTLSEMEDLVNQELARVFEHGVTEKEIQTSINNKETQLINSRATVFGKSNSLATYFTLTGNADNFNTELDRFRSMTPGEVLATAKRILTGKKVVLSVVPEGRRDLASVPREHKDIGGEK
jgi:zinc protease